MEGKGEAFQKEVNWEAFRTSFCPGMQKKFWGERGEKGGKRNDIIGPGDQSLSKSAVGGNPKPGGTPEELNRGHLSHKHPVGGGERGAGELHAVGMGRELGEGKKKTAFQTRSVQNGIKRKEKKKGSVGQFSAGTVPQETFRRLGEGPDRERDGDGSL